MKVEELWNKFIKEKGIDSKAKYEAWKFCGGGKGADELANLVLEGKKIATTSSLIAYQNENVSLPEIGYVQLFNLIMMKLPVLFRQLILP